MFYIILFLSSFSLTFLIIHIYYIIKTYYIATFIFSNIMH